MNVGERIKLLRKAKNWTQAELAEKISLTAGTLSAIEKNNSNTTNETIIKLSEIFEVSADYLLTGKEGTSEISPEEREIIKLYREDSQVREVLREAIDLKKKVMTQIKMLRQQPMDKQLKTEQV